MTAPTIEPGVHQLTDAEYFGPALAATTLSSTGARELLKPGGPARFRHKADAGAVEVKRHFDVGHAAHSLILGSGPSLVRIDADEWRSKAVKAEVEKVRAAGGVPMRPADFKAAWAMSGAVHQHPTAAKLLRSGEPERTLIWRDEATGVLCRAKADWLRPDGIVDVKTCESATEEALSKALLNYGYAIQAAFYLRGFRALHPGVTPFFTFIAVEKDPPHLVHVTQVGERSLAWGDRKVSEALEIYQACTEFGRWPGYPDDDITEIDLPAWVRTEEW